MTERKDTTRESLSETVAKIESLPESVKRDGILTVQTGPTGNINAFRTIAIDVHGLIAIAASHARQAEVIRVLLEAVEDMPKEVPTNWLDSLLTGPDKVIGDKPDCRAIEALLRGVQDRLRDKARAAIDAVKESK